MKKSDMEKLRKLLTSWEFKSETETFDEMVEREITAIAAIFDEACEVTPEMLAGILVEVTQEVSAGERREITLRSRQQGKWYSDYYVEIAKRITKRLREG